LWKAPLRQIKIWDEGLFLDKLDVFLDQFASSLRQLSLTVDQFDEDVEEVQLTTLPHLTSLELSNNSTPLTTLKRFSKSPLLSRLSLIHCDLTYRDLKLFLLEKGLPHLDTLDYRNQVFLDQLASVDDLNIEADLKQAGLEIQVIPTLQSVIDEFIGEMMMQQNQEDQELLAEAVGGQW